MEKLSCASLKEKVSSFCRNLNFACQQDDARTFGGNFVTITTGGAAILGLGIAAAEVLPIAIGAAAFAVGGVMAANAARSNHDRRVEEDLNQFRLEAKLKDLIGGAKPEAADVKDHLDAWRSGRGSELSAKPIQAVQKSYP